jgi:hypothetical protein
MTRDYELLNRILPGRVRSVEEWMRRSGTLVLKTFDDVRSKARYAARKEENIVESHEVTT